MGAEQYNGDMAYLRRLADNGTLMRGNAIWQKLDRKRNVPAVRSFMESIEHKLAG